MLLRILNQAWRSLADKRRRSIPRNSETTDVGRYDAERRLRLRLADNPSDLDSWRSLAKLLAESGRLRDALDCHRAVMRLHESDYWSTIAAAGLMHRLGDLEGALACYRSAMDIDRTQAAAIFSNMGVVHKDMVHIPDAIQCYQRSIEHEPALAEAHYNLGLLYYETGRIHEAETHISNAVRLKPEFAAAQSSLLCIHGLARNQDPQRLFNEHRLWAMTHADPLLRESRALIAKPENGQIVLGYVSADLREHSISYFIEPILSHHDKQAFRVICYDNWHGEDRVNLRLRNYADTWRKIDTMSDAEVAELIRRDGVDILVDLSGHTAGNRLLVFARKPAPVQVTWLGYMCTTGMKAMDYRITDVHLDPPGVTEAYYSETLVRIPAAAAFAPEQESPPVNPLPALERDFVTFLSANNFTKVGDEVIKTWARLLELVPESRLRIVALGGDDPSIAKSIIARFCNATINPALAARIQVQGRRPLRDFLLLFHEVDIALDPFPYSGGTTSLHTLWMGVPIVTLEGQSELSRSTSGMIRACGMPELIAQTTEQYVEIAQRIASDKHGLSSMRRQLRKRLGASVINNALATTRSLEAAYQAMWAAVPKARE
jgi:protein O-GlcNAc transferase